MNNGASIQVKKLIAILPGIIDSVGYSELYGYDLATIESIPNGSIILNTLLGKFLVANKYDVDQAAFQLQRTLHWRKTFNPLSAAFLETHDEAFQEMGIITSTPLQDTVTKTSTASKKATPVIQKKSESSASSVSSSNGSDNEDEPVEKVTKPKTELETESETAPVGQTPNVVESSTVAPTEKTAPTTTTTTEPEALHGSDPSPEQAVAPPTQTTQPVSAVPISPSPVTGTSAATGNLIVTWNFYGKVQNREKVFKNLDAFIRWRVGLMERGIAALDFTQNRTSYMDQVHDYHGTSFFRLDSAAREASKAVVQIFSDYYPEFPKVKYFVNVPRITSWIFAFTKAFLPKATVDKFRVVSDGKNLALETGNFWMPAQYGGETESLKSIEMTSAKPREKELVHEYDPQAAKEKFDPRPIPAPVPSEFTSGPVEPPAEVAKEPVPDVPASVTEEVLETGKPEMVFVNNDGSTETRPVPEPQPGAVPTPTATTTAAPVEQGHASPPAPQPGAVPQLATKTAVEQGPNHAGQSSDVTDTHTSAATTTGVAQAPSAEPLVVTAAKEVEPKTVA